jgi:hypothetical protein
MQAESSTTQADTRAHHTREEEDQEYSTARLPPLHLHLQQILRKILHPDNLEPRLPRSIRKRLLPRPTQPLFPCIQLDLPPSLQRQSNGSQKPLLAELTNVAVPGGEHDRGVGGRWVRRCDRLVEFELEQLVHALFSIPCPRRGRGRPRRSSDRTRGAPTPTPAAVPGRTIRVRRDVPSRVSAHVRL